MVPGFLRRVSRSAGRRLLRWGGGLNPEAAPAVFDELWVRRFFAPETGRPYDLGKREKQRLLAQLLENNRAIPSGQSWTHHLIVAIELLGIPPEVTGAVIECGCWKGAMTATLSLLCSRVGRELIVCDSFQGLPEDAPNAVHDYPHLQVYGYYEPGMYAAGLEEVRHNVARHGEISVCRFVPGFFCDTLPALGDRLAFAILDVDLATSLRDCVKHLWPLLNDGGCVYTDDSCDMEVVKVWFDEAWWRRELNAKAPGYVGSGCGLPLSPAFSSLGYARKVSAPEKSYGRIHWLRYPDAAAPGVQTG